MAKWGERRHYNLRAALYWLFRAAFLCVSTFVSPSGCGVEDGDATRNDRQTLGSTAVEETVEEDAGEIISPASVDDIPDLFFTARTTFCCNPLSIDFNAVANSEGFHLSADLEWDFGDGRKGRGQSINHTYAYPGRYLVTLVAKAVDGSEVRVAQDVEVGDILGGELDSSLDVDGADDDGTVATLLADAGPDQTVLEGAEVRLNGGGSTGSTPLAFSWRELSTSDVTLRSATSETAIFTAPAVEGTAVTLTFELSVTAGDVTARDLVNIQVFTDPGLDSDDATFGAHVEFITEPSGDTPPGSAEVSWRFLDRPNATDVYLGQGCCRCRIQVGGMLNPDADGVYRAIVDVPSDTTIWYYVRYTVRGVEYSSRSVYVNPQPGDPSAATPMVIWFQLWNRDLDVLRDVLRSGVVTHVMISGGDRVGVDYNQPEIREALNLCRNASVQTIWSRHLWNNFVALQTLEDTTDEEFYVAALSQVNAEATLLGADFSAIDGEAYGGAAFDTFFDSPLPADHFAAMGEAIRRATERVQVDFVYPCGTPFIDNFVNNLYPPLGRIRIAESTYYDLPRKNCRIDHPYDVFGAFVRADTERLRAPDSPYFLPYDVVLRRYLWSQSDGATGTVNGLFLYPGSPEDSAVTARLLARFFDRP